MSHTEVKEIEENNETYTVTTHFDSDGNIFATEKVIKSDCEPSETVYLSERDRAIMETAVNTEYLTCLAELAL